MLELNRRVMKLLSPLESGCFECCLHVTDITEIVRKFYKRQLKCSKIDGQSTKNNIGFSCHIAERILTLLESLCDIVQ